MSGSAAFLAPEMGIAPFNSAPPRILMRSIRQPFRLRRRRGSRAAALKRLSAFEIFPQSFGEPLFPPLGLRVAIRAGPHAPSPPVLAAP